MKAPSIRPVRCAIYTRVSTEYELEPGVRFVDAQYDAASAYLKVGPVRLDPDPVTI